MKLSSGVTLAGLRPEIKRAFPVVETVYLIYRENVTLLKGYIEESGYSKYHGMGLAIDVTLPSDYLDRIITGIKCRLGNQYKIKRFSNKLHIAYVGVISERSHTEWQSKQKNQKR